ncbi:MAG: response regulator transcription factor [Burkholderiales bacterium]|nr:response regulator transcription factor [Burkholderiales bacterium]
MRILLVEDETALRERVGKRLEKEGYRIDSCGDGREGLHLAMEIPYDAAIFDLGLPSMNGLDVIRALRKEGKRLPILILTARGRWQEKVEGLEAGGDDYLAKPFEMEELVARLKALLRRSAGAASSVLQCGPIALDTNAQVALLEGGKVELTAFEYRTLEYLMTHRGRVVSKSELSDILYPHEEDRDSNVLEVIVARLRKKLDPEGVLLPIETLRGRGYRFNLGESDVSQ